MCLSGVKVDVRCRRRQSSVRLLLHRQRQRLSQLPASPWHGAAQEGGPENVRPGQHQNQRSVFFTCSFCDLWFELQTCSDSCPPTCWLSCLCLCLFVGESVELVEYEGSAAGLIRSFIERFEEDTDQLEADLLEMSRRDAPCWCWWTFDPWSANMRIIFFKH